ncbi:hypothetical protein ACROYT_G016604 [Oculina patagonica]
MEEKSSFKRFFTLVKAMARGLYLLSLLLMSLLLSHVLAQERRGSYREKIKEKIEERSEKREHREEQREQRPSGWRRKRSVHVSRPELSKEEANNFINVYNIDDD